MKAKNYLYLSVFLMYAVFTGRAQCEVEAGKDSTIVCGSSVKLNAVPTTTVDSVLWSPSTGLSATKITSPIAAPILTTKYFVTTYTGLCIAIDSVTITVNPLQIEAGANKSLVCGGSAKLDSVTANYAGSGILTYSWSPATGLSNATIANPTVTITQSTTYYVTVTTPNSCSAIDSVTVTVNPFSIEAGINKIITCGGSVKLDSVTSTYTGNGKLSYSWSPKTMLSNDTIANPTAAPTQTTTYYVTATSLTGCKAMDSVLVLVNPLLIEAGADKNIVCGSSVKLDSVISTYAGNGKLSYSWSPSTGLSNDTIANPTATIKTTTKYYVTVTSPTGCKATDSITV